MTKIGYLLQAIEHKFSYLRSKPRYADYGPEEILRIAMLEALKECTDIEIVK
jgi:hypothetical protein